MKKIIYLLLISLVNLISVQLSAQSSSENEIKATILLLFEGMRQQDTNLINQAMTENATLETSQLNKEGVPMIGSTPIAGFKKSILGAEGHILDEIITSWDIKQDGNLASVWVDYLFYFDGNFSHCGVDAFQLAKVGETWKIMHITDTRRKDGCIEDNESQINVVMNAWHHAAAVADEETFFGSMTADGIYIGTDASEHWLRDSMAVWAQPYFEKETAWDFTTKERNIFVDEDGKLAWFDELLDTWMGVCRSSGVMKLVDGEWKIKHYHLSMAVPNEIIDDYVKLLKK